MNVRSGHKERFTRLAAVRWLMVIAGLLVAVGSVAPAAAASPKQTPSCTVTWVGGKSTAWELAGNWSPARIPNTHDWACIPAGTKRSPVVNGQDMVGGFTDTGKLTISGALTTSNSGSAAQVSGTLILDGSVSGPGGLTVSGTFTSNSGTLAGRGTTTIASGATLTLTGSTCVDGGSVINNGTTTLADNTSLNLGEYGTFSNAGTFNSQPQTNGNQIGSCITSNGTFSNSGTFEVTGTGTTTLDGDLLTDSGTIDLTNAKGTLDNDSQLNLESGSSVTGPGTLEDDGTLQADTATTLPNLTLDGILDGAGTVTVTGTMSSASATLEIPTTIASGATLTLTGSTCVDGGSVVNDGTTTLADDTSLDLGEYGTFTNAGTFNSQPQADGNDIGSCITSDGTFDNIGTFEVTTLGTTSLDGNLVTDSGAVDLANAKSTLDIDSQLNLESGSSVTGPGTLEDDGTLQADTAVTLPNLTLDGGTLDPGDAGALTISDLAASPSGTIDVQADSASEYGTVKISGTISLASLGLSFYDSYSAAAKDTLAILTASSVTGKFDSVSGTSGTGQLSWTVKYLKTGVQLIAN
jgi:fibronectin-binding autotransporter adhesin